MPLLEHGDLDQVGHVPAEPGDGLCLVAVQ
jgi:hypothetical protein